MSSPVNAIPASPKRSSPTKPFPVLLCWRSSSTISPARRRGRRHDRNTTLVRLRSFLYTMDRHPAALGGTVIPLPAKGGTHNGLYLSLIHISEPTRRTPISYAVFCLK